MPTVQLRFQGNERLLKEQAAKVLEGGAEGIDAGTVCGEGKESTTDTHSSQVNNLRQRIRNESDMRSREANP